MSGVRVTMNSDEVQATAKRIDAEVNSIVEACKLFNADIAPISERAGVKFLKDIENYTGEMTKIAEKGVEVVADAVAATNVYIADLVEIATDTTGLGDM